MHTNTGSNMRTGQLCNLLPAPSPKNAVQCSRCEVQNHFACFTLVNTLQSVYSLKYTKCVHSALLCICICTLCEIHAVRASVVCSRPGSRGFMSGYEGSEFQTRLLPADCPNTTSSTKKMPEYYIQHKNHTWTQTKWISYTWHTKKPSATTSTIALLFRVWVLFSHLTTSVQWQRGCMEQIRGQCLDCGLFAHKQLHSVSPSMFWAFPLNWSTYTLQCSYKIAWVGHNRQHWEQLPGLWFASWLDVPTWVHNSGFYAPAVPTFSRVPRSM